MTKIKYNIMYNVGTIKYLVNFSDGTKKERDGSEFWDIRTFKSKVKMNKFIKTLKEG